MNRIKQMHKRARQRRAPAQNNAGRNKTESGQKAPERLQKVLAAAGIASRRQCERLILEGRVEVDQQVVTTLGTRVDPTTQAVRVDGVLLTHSEPVYYLINKPKGVVCTHRDPAGRMRLVDLVPDEPARMFSVGRLDRESEGLILLTNDGTLAQQLAHPRYGVAKTYQVQVAGIPNRATLNRLRTGVRLAEAVVAVSAVRVKRTHKQSTVLEIVLREGKNREIRRILAALGHKVQRLKRVALGPLKLGKLPQGSVRPLERSELTALKRLATDETEKPRTPRQRKTSKGSKLQRGGRDSKFAGRSKKTKPPTGRKKTATRSKR